jgi:hypothetical protein
LRVQDFKPNGAEQQPLQKRLGDSGYRWRAEGDAWLMTVAPNAEAKP